LALVEKCLCPVESSYHALEMLERIGGGLVGALADRIFVLAALLALFPQFVA
jgi:hypothetical protein